MSDTMKLRNFCENPINNRGIGDVPGVGPIAARKLKSMGYVKAQDLYDKLKKQNFDENKFRVWIGINVKGAKVSIIYKALKKWHRQFGGGADDSETASTSQSPARESAPAQRKKVQLRRSRTTARDSDAEDSGISDVSNSRFLFHSHNAMSLFFASCADSSDTILPEYHTDLKMEILAVMSKFENKSREKTATAKPSMSQVHE